MHKPTKKREAQKLPGRLQAIADAAGIDAAIAIAREFGGRRLYLPASKTLRRCRQHPLVGLLGLERALKVVETIDGFGEYFDVPTARNELIYLKLRDGLSRGLSTSELAQETGICRRAVLYRLAAMRATNSGARKRPWAQVLAAKGFIAMTYNLLEDTAALSVSAPLPKPGAEPPTWITIFPQIGRISTRDGRNYDVDAQALFARFEADGPDIPIDINHSTPRGASTGERADAVGWITDLRVKDGALQGKVDWSEEGREVLRKRTHRFVSRRGSIFAGPDTIEVRDFPIHECIERAAGRNSKEERP